MGREIGSRRNIGMVFKKSCHLTETAVDKQSSYDPPLSSEENKSGHLLCD
jgi:hypothetical protein